MASHLLGYYSFGIMYRFGENQLSLWLAIIFKYYRISYDNTIHEIMDISYCIILLAILVHIEAYIIWIWNISVYQLLRYFMYSISYGTVIESFTTITQCIGLHLIWQVFCILYDIVMTYHWLSFIEILWYVTFYCLEI